MSFQLPPFAECTEMLGFRHSRTPSGQDIALQKLRAPEDKWDTRNQQRVPHAYAIDRDWQAQAEFVSDQQELVAFLIRKWTKELGGRLIRELWAWPGAKTAIHFTLERLAGAGTWIRFRRNENEKFGANGLMKLRLISVSDFPINKPDRMMGWGRSDPRAAHNSRPFHFSSPTIVELKSKRRPE
jgi:nuclear transport factor 2 (NTF2) superfamily protein